MHVAHTSYDADKDFFSNGVGSKGDWVGDRRRGGWEWFNTLSHVLHGSIQFILLFYYLQLGMHTMLMFCIHED